MEAIMSIFQSDEKQTTAQQQAKQIREMNGAFLRRAERFVEQQMSLLWGSDDPQAILDEFGTEAYQLFELSRGLQDFIQQADPDYEKLTPAKWGYSVTINDDGSVTVTKI